MLIAQQREATERRVTAENGEDPVRPASFDGGERGPRSRSLPSGARVLKETEKELTGGREEGGEGGQRKGMADPLRRTLLAKLRGKKPKKGATIGGGYGSAAAAAAANEGREGKEKVSQMQQQRQRDSGETRPAATGTGLDCTAGRMSTYENCDDGPAAVRSGGEVAIELRESRSAESAGTRPQERCGGGRVRVNEDPPGVSLQRVAQYGEGEPTYRGDRSVAQKIASSAAHHGPRVPGKHFVSVPRQRSAGDSIGFGDNSNHPVFRAHTGEAESSRAVSTSDRDMTEPGVRGHSRHMAVKGHNANWSFDNRATEPASNCNPHSTLGNLEENILIRNVESYRPGSDAETRGTVGTLQSPTFFPTQLEICDIHTASTGDSLRYTLDSEDDDYYDNKILPFYETVRLKSDRAEVAQVPLSDQEKGDDGNMAQETDRLRNQLKEAYYLLINAMNDINLDLQQISGGTSEQQAVSSCSSRSRDSLCSRLSGRNMDSDSWSSGGDRSPQQVSDTDSLLLCLSGSHGSDFKCLKSKSTEDLRSSEKRPTLPRSASDGAIGCLVETSLSFEVPREQGPSRAVESKDSPGQLHDAAGGDEGHGIGELDESSSSVDSLTGSSDGNAEEPQPSQGQDDEKELAEIRAERSDSVGKGHGVTVNKMQEWMHRGRLLSTEMKQRIEGSPSPRTGAQCQDPLSAPATPVGCKTPVQAYSRGVRCVKAKCPTVKSPQRLKPGRKATTPNRPRIPRTL